MNPEVSKAVMKWEKAKLARANAEIDIHTSCDPEVVKKAHEEMHNQGNLVRKFKADVDLSEKATGTYYQNTGGWDCDNWD